MVGVTFPAVVVSGGKVGPRADRWPSTGPAIGGVSFARRRCGAPAAAHHGEPGV